MSASAPRVCPQAEADTGHPAWLSSLVVFALAGGLSCAGAEKTVVTGTSGPAIALSSPGLTFSVVQDGGSPASQQITITNSGGGTLSGLSVGPIVYVVGASGWLQTPAFGSTTASPSATLTLQPVTASLTPGTYAATIPVLSAAAANSPQNVTVTLTVTPPPAPPPQIALTSASLSFNATGGGASAPSQLVTITNSGGGALSGLSVGTIVYGAGATGWLTPTLNPATASPSATLTVQTVTGSLAAGTYSATVPVLSAVASNTPQNVTVTLTVGAAPTISLSSTSLAFNAGSGETDPPSQLVTITNAGSGTLSGLSVGSIVYGAGATGWLLAPSLTSATAGSSATLTLQPVTGSLATGTYTATIPVLSAMASNSPQSITVTFTVGAPAIVLVPQIGLAPAGLSFTAVAGGANPASQLVTITNSGTGSLSGLSIGTITYGAGATGWLQTPALSSTTASPSAMLTVQPVTGTRGAGIYTATIPVLSTMASNSPRNVTVTLTVTSTTALTPLIGLTPTSVTFSAPQGGSATPAAELIVIRNVGTGSLTGLSYGPVAFGQGISGWLRMSGTVPSSGAAGVVALIPDPAGLAQGTYTASIPINSTVAGNSPQIATVTLTVTQPTPLISLAPTSVSFTATAGAANPASQQVTITNSGVGSLTGLSVGTITYGVGATGWLQTPALGSTAASPSATLTLQPLTGTLAAGTYTATVPVLSAVASNSPQTVAVSFTVAPQPISYSGSWTGTTSQGHPVSFTVVNNAITTITFAVGATGSCGAFTATTTRTFPTPLPITGAAFGYSDPGSGSLATTNGASGTFSGAKTASGSVNHSRVQSPPSTPCTSSGTATWTATRP